MENDPRAALRRLDGCPCCFIETKTRVGDNCCILAPCPFGYPWIGGDDRNAGTTRAGRVDRSRSHLSTESRSVRSVEDTGESPLRNPEGFDRYGDQRVVHQD